MCMPRIIKYHFNQLLFKVFLSAQHSNGSWKIVRCNLKKAVDRLQNKLSFIGKEMAAVPSQPNTTQNFSFFDITTSLILGLLVVGNWYLSKPGIC